jgi:hypothetical protein
LVFILCQAAWNKDNIRECQELVELDEKLPAILKGTTKPQDAQEALALADLCYRKSLYVAAARLFGQAFESRTGLADSLQADQRHPAASAAALAGCGKGKDDPPDGAARARWREKAREWLRAELAAWEKLLMSDSPQTRDQLKKTLAHWKEERDLVGLREEAELAKLPDAERRACQVLWTDVDMLLKKANASAPAVMPHSGHK